MKIAITGASGLVGYHAARACLERGHEVHAFYNTRKPDLPNATLRQLDLAEPEAADAVLLELFPDVIIHAAAASNPTKVAANPELAEKLNVALPRRLAQVAHHLGTRLIHLSTDMVFDGEEAPYRSTDLPNPLDLYGQLKLLAEREVLEHGVDYVTVLRITIVTGDSPSGARSVHESLFEAWAKGEQPTLFTDEIRQPVAASNLGTVLAELCERPNLHGLFHWAGNEAISRYDMGQQILKHFGLPENLIAPASCKGMKRAADLRLELQPLLSKIRTAPLSFENQLPLMSVPDAHREWYTQTNGKTLPIKITRLRKGVDY